MKQLAQSGEGDDQQKVGEAGRELDRQKLGERMRESAQAMRQSGSEQKAAAGADDIVEVDSRPSDAVALALRTGDPIWIARSVLDGALTSQKASEAEADRQLREWLENARPEDLGKYSM